MLTTSGRGDLAARTQPRRNPRPACGGLRGEGILTVSPEKGTDGQDAMTGKWIIGAQLSTSHSPLDALNLDRMLEVVERVRAAIELDILVVGAREAPGIFREFCGPRRPVSEAFLWYNVLSDIEGMEDSDLVVNWRGERSRGWGGWAEAGAEVNETFRFVCPNNPAPRRKTLLRLRELLGRYSFAGVFLDKIRFPSPANSLDEALSCFCDHCRNAARSVDLDLGAVIRMFEDRAIELDTGAASRSDEGSGYWLRALAGANPLLSRFVQFRADSITRLASEACEEARRLGRKVSLDLFSPCLAQMVGQDYRRLSQHCVWAKPMTYRVARGPAGLRLEIPALVEGVVQMFKVDERRIVDWARRRMKAFDGATLTRTRESAVPMAIMRAELETAVRAMHPSPVYFGLELVSQPGVIDIKPAQVREMARAGRAANAAGLIISWDLMHAPADGLRTLAAEISRDP